MPNWTDRWAWDTPKDRFIAARLPDGTDVTVMVRWHPIRQTWIDQEGNEVPNWTEWRECQD